MKVRRNFLKVGRNFLPPTHPIFLSRSEGRVYPATKIP
jgi:hypothetical protein